MMLILGLLGIYFDAAVVFVTNQTLLLKLAVAILCKLTFNNLSKDHMFTIQPFSHSGTNEKLRPVGVGSSIGHRQNSGSGVSQFEIFIFELVSINRFSTSSIVSSKIST